jgi:hypothetical protein
VRGFVVLDAGFSYLGVCNTTMPDGASRTASVQAIRQLGQSFEVFMDMMHSAKRVAVEFLQRFGTVLGFFALTFLGVFLYMFGYSHAPASEDPDDNLVWYAQLALDLGNLILISAILGAFVRFLHTFKAIREVVTDVFYGDDILRRRKDIDQIWAKLSKHIFIPDFSNDNGLSDDLQDRIVEQLKEGMKHNKTFYVRSSDRTITVKWADADNNIIDIVDSSVEEYVPFEKGGKITWEHVFSAGDGAKNDDYSPDFSVIIDGNTVVPKKKQDESGTILTYACEMEGRDLYKVTKRSTRRWDIQADPLIVFISKHIVESLRLEINCLDDDIRPFFEEHHLTDKFFVQRNEAGEQRPSDYVTLCTSPILPGDGFTIGLIKVA